jgi:hypothetical protein
MDDSRKGENGPCIDYDAMPQKAVCIDAIPEAVVVAMVGVRAGNVVKVDKKMCSRSRRCNVFNSLKQHFRPNFIEYLRTRYILIASLHRLIGVLLANEKLSAREALIPTRADQAMELCLAESLVSVELICPTVRIGDLTTGCTRSVAILCDKGLNDHDR